MVTPDARDQSCQWNYTVQRHTYVYNVYNIKAKFESARPCFRRFSTDNGAPEMFFFSLQEAFLFFLFFFFFFDSFINYPFFSRRSRKTQNANIPFCIDPSSPALQLLWSFDHLSLTELIFIRTLHSSVIVILAAINGKLLPQSQTSQMIFR